MARAGTPVAWSDDPDRLTLPGSGVIADRFRGKPGGRGAPVYAQSMIESPTADRTVDRTAGPTVGRGPGRKAGAIVGTLVSDALLRVGAGVRRLAAPHCAVCRVERGDPVCAGCWQDFFDPDCLRCRVCGE